MIKFDADFCRSHCPYRDKEKKFGMRFESVHSASITPPGCRTTFFFHPSNIYGPDCARVHISNGDDKFDKVKEANKDPFGFLEKYCDVERDGRGCPLYAERMVRQLNGE